jgi:hypothetical protein
VRDWTDEELSAHLDGELDATTAAALEADLANDPALTDRLAALAGVDDLARAAFAAPMDAPVPDRLRAVLEAPAPVIDLASRRRPAERPAWLAPVLAAAAALGVGFFVGTQQTAPALPQALLQADATVITQDNPAFALLEQTPSAQTVNTVGGGVFKPVVSFTAADGRTCREFELAADQASAVGVACRGADSWRLEILLAADDRPDASAGYVQASGFNAAALDAALDQLGAGPPLDPAQERDLITRGWAKP